MRLREKSFGKFLKFLADICIKGFQIIFGMLVVGTLLQREFNVTIFTAGLSGSFFTLTLGILLYYSGCYKEEKI